MNQYRIIFKFKYGSKKKTQVVEASNYDEAEKRAYRIARDHKRKTGNQIIPSTIERLYQGGNKAPKISSKRKYGVVDAISDGLNIWAGL